MNHSVNNHFTVSGQIVRLSKTRYSPAGLPITRFVLEHSSQQVEAGLPRQARFRITVMSCGFDLHKMTSQLAIGCRINVSGFISRANNRAGEARLVLHADRLTLLPTF